MRLLQTKRGSLLRQFEQRLDDGIAQIPALVRSAWPKPQTTTGRIAMTAGWLSAGISVLALGIFAGREIRSRYKFKRLTPYDFYAHSGDRFQDADFSVGV